jgi:hypothetical protein
MGGVKDLILLVHDNIETELAGALPERIYSQLEIGTDGHSLIVANQHGYKVCAECLIETGAIYVRTSGINTAFFTGTRSAGSAGRYIAYLMECDE